MALNTTMTSHGLNLTNIPPFNLTNFTFDYEGEDPRFFDPTEDSNEEYIWDPPESGSGELNPIISKVFGGQNATRGEVPHQVSLRNVATRGSHFCGASIIHPLLLLTAAHCVTVLNLIPEQIQVVTGEHNVAVREEGEQVRNVSQIILHDGWNSTTFENDIAILVLNEPLNFDNYTSSIKIAKGDEIRLKKAKVSGWGKTSQTDVTAFPAHQIALIRFVKWEHCRGFYSRGAVQITENMVCAGGKKRDACEGDSGGPLTCQKIQSNETYLCGIVSWGGKKCGTHGTPGVYTDVAKYFTWIRKYVRIWDRRYQNSSETGEQADALLKDYLLSRREPVRLNVTGAQAAMNGEFPYQAHLVNGLRPHVFCSASVIHPLLLITTAHCVKYEKAEEILAITGDYRLRTLDGTEQMRSISQIILSHRYDPTAPGDNDIAILVLEEPLRFDNYTSPIEIPRRKWSRSCNAFVSSWELTNPIQGTSDSLLKLPVLLVDQADCRSAFMKLQTNVTDNMICVKSEKDGRCGGDSGDPLTCRRGRSGSRYLCGIVAWGIGNGCESHPLVCTDATRHHQWIHKHMDRVWKKYQVSILGGSIDSRQECGEDKSRCPNNGICIPKDFICDGEYDCDPLNDWDERDCSIIDQASDLAAAHAAKNSSGPN